MCAKRIHPAADGRLMTTTDRCHEFVSDEVPAPGAFEVADMHSVYGDCWVAYTTRIVTKLGLVQVGRALRLEGLAEALEHQWHHRHDHAAPDTPCAWETEFDESDGRPAPGLPDLCGDYDLPALGSQ